MKKDPSPQNYKKICQQLKEEKLNWDFDDFLSKVDGKSANEEVAFLPKKANQKWGAIAAVFVFLMGFGWIISTFSNSKSVENRENLSKVVKAPLENTLPKIVENIPLENTEVELPISRKINAEPLKKKRSKNKKTNEHFAKNQSKKLKNKREISPIIEDEITYDPSFVVINGKPIATEKEAIIYTKNAIDMLGGNINAALENAESVKLLTVNF